MAAADQFETYLAEVDPAMRPALDRLRAIVRGAHDGLDEQVKWNAPSFSHKGEDRVTLGLDNKGGLRIVLHRGARPRDTSTFVFADETGLARWPAPDRGVVTLRDDADIDAKSAQLAILVRNWIEATA